MRIKAEVKTKKKKKKRRRTSHRTRSGYTSTCGHVCPAKKERIKINQRIVRNGDASLRSSPLLFFFTIHIYIYIAFAFPSMTFLYLLLATASLRGSLFFYRYDTHTGSTTTALTPLSFAFTGRTSTTRAFHLHRYTRMRRTRLPTPLRLIRLLRGEGMVFLPRPAGIRIRPRHRSSLRRRRVGCTLAHGQRSAMHARPCGAIFSPGLQVGEEGGGPALRSSQWGRHGGGGGIRPVTRASHNGA